jgi:AcrR family transcriptional regulator
MESAARERLLDAMLIELAESGYGKMNVADVLVLSGVSRSDFAAEFADEDACLFAAYERLTERLARRTSEGCAVEGDWAQRVGCGLGALLEELAGRPAMAWVLIRAFPSISPRARALYQDFVEGFATLLGEGRQFSETGAELPAEVEMLAVGAAEAIVFDEIDAGRAAELPALGPEILFSVLVPFMGPEAASAEMQRASDAAA